MGDEQEIGFVRQRRNLMIISLVLLFAEAAELKISKLSVFGSDLILGKSLAVNLALWIAGLYWLWRFYQYSRPFFKSTLRGAIYSHTQSLAPKVAMRKILRENPSLSEPFEDAPDLTPQFSYGDLAHGGKAKTTWT